MGSTNDARPGSLPGLRATNRRRVLEVLATTGGSTQAGLARATGLSAASVSGLVRELTRSGEVTATPGTSDGRRGRVVQLVAERLPLACGVDLGRTHVRVVLGSSAERVVAERVVGLEVGHSPTETLRTVVDLVRTCCEAGGVGTRDLVGVGLGAAWPIDASGAVIGAPSPSGWAGVDIGKALTTSLGCTVDVENDAKLGAVAVADERRLDQPVVFVKIGSGIGAGIAHRGEVVRGRRGLAGDIGHLTVDPALTTVCQCGRRGCLETVASMLAIRRTLGAAVDRDLTVEEALTLVEAGDPVALRVVEQAGEFIGRALGWLATVLDPALIVIGGPAAAAGDALLAPVVDGFRRAVTGLLADTPIELASMGDRTEAVGALVHARERHLLRVAP